MSSKIFVFMAVLLVGVSCSNMHRPYQYEFEGANILEDSRDDHFIEEGIRYIPSRVAYEYEDDETAPHRRVSRQVHGKMNTNPDGSVNLAAQLPIAGNNKHMLSAVGSLGGAKQGSYQTAGAGLAYDHVNGHGLSLTGTHIPSFGDQLTAAGKLNLINTPDHKLNANAFVTNNMPSIPNIPNFQTHGGSLDYMFKDKVGGSLGMSQTPLFQKTDYSAMSNLNLFRDRTSSLDLNAGFSKSVSPFIQNSRWQPSAGLSFTKYW